MNVPALEFERFGFAYPGGPPIVNDLSWIVPAGSFTLLVGATGCGKTTLLRCVKPEISPAGTRRGTLLVFGSAPAKANDSDATLAVGYVSQSPHNQLVCDTVWHEIAFGMENLGVSNAEMSRRVAEVAHFFGIEPWIDRKTADLSGGQAQMVNLAAALAMRPRVLLLDEPTAQLDPVASKNFAHALFRINRELNMTVIVATHEPEIMADYATDCVLMEQGSLSACNLSDYASNVGEWPQVSRAARSCLNRCRAGERGGDDAVALAFHDVFMRYDRDDDWVLTGFDVSFERGGIHAVVGGNGCGKSTLLRVAAGVAKTERGRVERPLRSSQVLLPQNPKALFVCDTVAEEMREWQSGCGYTQEDVDGMLADFGLLDRKDYHPYDLSGGQQQLLALAKLLLTRPNILLLDEPSKGLDAQMKAIAAVKLLRCADRGATVVMSTHDLPFAALVADDVAMMFDGACACFEPTDSFFQGNLFYRPAPDGFSRFLASLEDVV